MSVARYTYHGPTLTCGLRDGDTVAADPREVTHQRGALATGVVHPDHLAILVYHARKPGPIPVPVSALQNVAPAEDDLPARAQHLADKVDALLDEVRALQAAIRAERAS